jgi:hypothetical protein
VDRDIGVTQLLVTVAAASIAFGGDKNPRPALLIIVAKSFLAWSIFYGVLFCAFVLYRYDEYTQDVTSYTKTVVLHRRISRLFDAGMFCAGVLGVGLGTIYLTSHTFACLTNPGMRRVRGGQVYLGLAIFVRTIALNGIHPAFECSSTPMSGKTRRLAPEPPAHAAIPRLL